MTTKPHPTEAMEMPVMAASYPDQLRAERIKAYDLGRQEALEDAAKEADDGIWFDKTGTEVAQSIGDAIRSMKHEQQ